MTTDKVYVGDTGTAVILDCGQDISDASARSIKVRKPDRTLVTWAASASGTTAISYTSLAATFDQPGTYRLQAEVTLPAGKWLGATVLLDVHKVFE